MKKRNLIATLCAAAVMACGLMLASCASQPDPAEAIKADLAAQFDPLKNLDQAAIDELAADVEAQNAMLQESYGIDAVEYLKSMLEGLDYEIGEVTVAEDGQSATATVSVTCKSFTDAADRTTELSEEFAASEEFLSMTSTEEMEQKLGEIIMQAMNETETKATDCTFDYELVDGTWTMGGGAEQQLYKAFFA